MARKWLYECKKYDPYGYRFPRVKIKQLKVVIKPRRKTNE